MLDINRFSWKQALSDNSGKTSASSIGGILLVFISSIVFGYASFTKYELGITQSVIMAGIGSALLGVHKWRDSLTPVSPDATEPEKTDNING